MDNILKGSQDYVIYLIVRNDLKMGKGKIAAQCGHAIQHLTIINLASNSSIFNKYLRFGGAKICLKVNSEKELDNITGYCKQNNITHYQVVDAGRTQVEPNTKTVLGIGPILKSDVPSIISELKLL